MDTKVVERDNESTIDPTDLDIVYRQRGGTEAKQDPDIPPKNPPYPIPLPTTVDR